MSSLSVFIPTFNRPAALKTQLDLFAPQLGDTPLTVIDNGSEMELRHLIPSNMRYIRNVANIGATANVLRCVELCETDWIWICGDDDPVLPDGICRAKEIISEFSDTCYVSTTSRIVTHKQNTRTSSIPQLLGLVEDIGRLFWLTGNLYNVRQLRQHLRVAHYLPNAAPQMVLVLMAMSRGIPAGVSTSSIAYNAYPDDPSQRWNEHEVLCYLSGLVDLPLPLNDRKAIAVSLSNMIFSFDEHFLRVLNAVVQGAPGVVDLIALFGSRWSRIFVTLEDLEKLKFLLARLDALRRPEECKELLRQIGPQGMRPVEITPRFQRL